jgi:hypothetical protein
MNCPHCHRPLIEIERRRSKSSMRTVHRLHNCADTIFDGDKIEQLAKTRFSRRVLQLSMR